MSLLSCASVVVLAASVALSSTVGINIGGSWNDEQRIVFLVVLALASISVLALRIGPGGLIAPAIALALALGLTSGLLSSRPYVALLDWAVYCLIACLVVGARACSVHLNRAAALLAAIVPTAYVTGVVASYLSALVVHFPVGAETLLVGFSNPRFPAQLQVLTIPLLPLAIQMAPSRFWRTCLLVVGSLWWMCFIGSGSRTGWIAIAAAAFVTSFLGVEGRRWVRLQMPFAVSGAVLWIALFSLLPSVLSIPSTPETGRFSNFTSVGARWELWRLSIDAALANPWLGLGPMHFAYVDNGLAAHPHNFWLQLAAEWGIPAMLLVLFATLSLAVSLWRRLHQERDKSRRSVGIALLATAIAWGIGTMSDGYMVIPTSQAMSTAVLMLAVMWVRLEEPARAPSPRIDRLTRIVSTTFLAVALGVLAALPFTDFGQPTLREQAWRAEHPGQMMWPRFWQQGWIGPDSDATARPGGLADPTSK